MGKMKFYLPYMGMFTIWLNDYAWFKYTVLGLMGFFVLIAKDPQWFKPSSDITNSFIFYHIYWVLLSLFPFIDTTVIECHILSLTPFLRQQKFFGQQNSTTQLFKTSEWGVLVTTLQNNCCWQPRGPLEKKIMFLLDKFWRGSLWIN